MDLATIQANVDTITGRSDRVDERNLAIQEATLSLHAMENFWRDQVDQQVVFQAVANYQQIPLINLPRFRTFRYIRKFDPTGNDPLTGITGGGVPSDYFDPCPPDKILDKYAVTKDNIYYLSGGGQLANAVCQLRSTVGFQYLLVGWMGFPKVEPLAQFQSWIAELYPYAIITSAAMKLKKYVVDPDQVKLLATDEQRHIANLLTNAVEFSSR